MAVVPADACWELFWSVRLGPAGKSIAAAGYPHYCCQAGYRG
jgi:hypothetical protein